MHEQTLCIYTALSLALIASGCTSTTPRIDSQFGDAARIAIAQQTINPDAGKNPAADKGMDGKAALEVMDRYQKSFRTPPPQSSVFTIGVSGGGGQ